MAYNYGSYPYYYNPYQAANQFAAPPYQYQGAQQPQAQPQQNLYSGFQWVRGENAAKAFRAEPGQTVLLMDSDAPVLYVNSTDVNGKPAPMVIYDLIERTEVVSRPVESQDLSEYAKKSEINNMLSKINMDDYIKRSEVDDYISESVTRAISDKIKNIRLTPQTSTTPAVVSGLSI